MNQSYYEALLRKNNDRTVDSEKTWDERAGRFYEAQKKDKSIFPNEVIKILESRGILDQASILDIGGGSGRYALPLARKAKHITLTDISGNMLKLAKENAEQNGIQNIAFKKLEWEKAALSSLGWERMFDLAFAAMCPAIRTPAGLYKMSQASKGYCMINQFIHSTDSLSGFLRERTGSVQHYNPHNDRESVQAIFNLLWMQGYDVEMQYVKSEEVYTLSKEEIRSQYAFVLERIQKETGEDTEKLFVEYEKREKGRIEEQTTLAVLLWNVADKTV